MTDKEIKAAAFGIIAYQTILNQGQTPNITNKETTVVIDSANFKAFKEAIQFCGKAKIDNAKILFTDLTDKGGSTKGDCCRV